MSVCLYICVSVGHVHESCKNGWTDPDAVLRLTYVGPRNHALDAGQYRTNLFAATRGDKSDTRFSYRGPNYSE